MLGRSPGRESAPAGPGHSREHGIVMMLTASGSLSFTCSFPSSIWAIDPRSEDSSEAFKNR